MENRVISKSDVEELIDNTRIVNSNLGHLDSAVEFLCITKGRRIPVSLSVNPLTGELVDRDYKGNRYLQISDWNSHLFMEEKGRLTERARQNISNTFLIYTEYHL